MNETISTIVILLVIALVTTVVLFSWAVIGLIKSLARGIVSLFALFSGGRRHSLQRCPRPICNHLNPCEALYCRRCGSPLHIAGGIRKCDFRGWPSTNG